MPNHTLETRAQENLQSTQHFDILCRERKTRRGQTVHA
jgi:hypothetical protein